MSVVTLVPWRPGNRERERTWDFVRPKLEALGWRVVTGDGPGKWARAAAINDAARRAGDWSVALIADADTVPEVDAIHTAVERVAHDGGALRPHNKLWMLSRIETKRFMVGAPIEPQTRHPGGGLLVVSREAWDAVGGYDERFIGWGHEDSDFNTRLVAYSTWDISDGNAWHLWHPRDAKDTPERFQNHRMMKEVQHQYRSAIARASSERGFDLRTVL